MTLVNQQPLTNVQKKLCCGGPRYPSVDTVKLEKTLKNMSNILAKIVKKSIFSKIKLANLPMKKCTSIRSKICPAFYDLVTHFHAFYRLAVRIQKA